MKEVTDDRVRELYIDTRIKVGKGKIKEPSWWKGLIMEFDRRFNNQYFVRNFNNY